jgi:hypothetical protein
VKKVHLIYHLTITHLTSQICIITCACMHFLMACPKSQLYFACFVAFRKSMGHFDDILENTVMNMGFCPCHHQVCNSIHCFVSYGFVLLDHTNTRVLNCAV